MRKVALLVLAFALPAMSYADTYKWVDEEGVVHYTDQPPPPGARKVEQKKLNDSVIGTTMPYALQRTAKNFPVTLYSNDCGDPCKDGRSLLNKRGIPFAEKNPQDPAVQSEMIALTRGAAGVPVLRIGSSVVRGFEEAQWNTALDGVGYPKTSVLPKQLAKPKSQSGGDKSPGAAPAVDAVKAGAVPAVPAEGARRAAPPADGASPPTPAAAKPVQR